MAKRFEGEISIADKTAFVNYGGGLVRNVYVFIRGEVALITG